MRLIKPLRQQFHRHIAGRLAEYGVTEEQLKDGDTIHGQVTGFILDNGDKLKAPGVRGFRRQAKYYTLKEDKAIVDFIQDSGRWEEVGGVVLWKLMATRKVLKGRSWQSMKERYRKSICKKLHKFRSNQEQGEEIIDTPV